MKRLILVVALTLWAASAQAANWKTDRNLVGNPNVENDTNIATVPFVKIGKGMRLFLQPTNTNVNQAIDTGPGGMFCSWDDGPTSAELIAIDVYTNQEFWAMKPNTPCRPVTVGECSNWKAEPYMLIQFKQSIAGTGGLVICAGQ